MQPCEARLQEIALHIHDVQAALLFRGEFFSRREFGRLFPGECVEVAQQIFVVSHRCFREVAILPAQRRDLLLSPREGLADLRLCGRLLRETFRLIDRLLE